MLTRSEAVALAREVVAGKSRSFVQAAHAFAELIVFDADEAARHEAALAQRAKEADHDDPPDDHEPA